MTLISESSDQYEQLRSQLKRYEASLASAKDRLEAFSRLEAIAKERHQTPEVVAARAAIELLENKESTLRASVDALRGQREATQEELSMLLVSKKQATIDLEEVRVNREYLADDVAVILNEIEAMRSDARRLQSEKAELETQVMELRLVVQDLARKEEKLQPEHDNRRVSDAPCSDEVVADVATSEDDVEVEVEDPTRGIGMNADESAAFDRFFNAGDADDKARDWMLG